MLRFQEVESGGGSGDGGDGGLVAKRYRVLQSLGRGSFGSVYLVQDTKATDEEELKVLKQIPLGDLRPDETVRANQEAQLLSQLQHPAIVSFHHSFLERDNFCIITEYCQDRDLDCKLEEVRQAGRSLPEIQVIDWLIQLLLGLHYMHDRRILHRDLKAKNVFLKRNLVKIGDFGVSCLLMGSCDLATTFTGTPYYMSPEVLNHHGYDSKSDIWALGCLLYEMCCLSHAFHAPNFLSVVMKIVEGETPTLPLTYSTHLNSVMQRMLQKQPSSRPSAAELLRNKFMEENMQKLKDRFVFVSSEGEKDAELIAEKMKTKVHLQTLRERSEVEKMTPRERMRLRKMQTADETAETELAEEKYEEIHARRRELISLNVLHESREGGACQSQPISSQDHWSAGGSQPIELQGESTSPSPVHQALSQFSWCLANVLRERIPKCRSYHTESSAPKGLPSGAGDGQEAQLSDLQAMMKHMQKVLEGDLSGDPEEPETPKNQHGPPIINCSLLETRVHRLRQSVCQRLGSEAFKELYENLKESRRLQKEEGERDVGGRGGEGLVDEQEVGLQVDQLLFYEEELQRVRQLQVDTAV
ncbi:serine/threonine-protein kinase Nek11 [Scomber japonicus]|uniref:serine/threonine-protein kinase Nek11 n=1 Tax=Scomber japonicus TaxID=13676 RepID=UPI0023061478|nr:serine/threonine-protein kinase Nek11 [Scomber japonicus]